MATEIVAFNFHERKLNTPGCLGVVNDVRYIRCLWPALDEPVALFAEGSSGIEVQGPPTPRNVLFPPGTAFLNTVVNDAKLGERPRWRVTDVPTKGDCYFIRTREERDVKEQQTSTDQVMVRGEMREVSFQEEVTIRKEVDVVNDLTVEDARAHVGSR